LLLLASDLDGLELVGLVPAFLARRHRHSPYIHSPPSWQATSIRFSPPGTTATGAAHTRSDATSTRPSGATTPARPLNRTNPTRPPASTTTGGPALVCPRTPVR